jgi:hypothetical protein
VENGLMEGKETMNNKIKIVILALVSLMLACNSVAIGNLQKNESNFNDVKQSGFIMPVDLYATLAGLQGVIKGNPGTFLMGFRNVVMFAWPDRGCYSFAVFEASGKPILDMVESMGLNGQRVDIWSMTDFVKFLQSKGWQFMDPNQLPATMLAALQSYAITAAATGARALVTIPILILPSTTQILLPTPEVIKQ